MCIMWSGVECVMESGAAGCGTDPGGSDQRSPTSASLSSHSQNTILTTSFVNIHKVAAKPNCSGVVKQLAGRAPRATV